MVYGRNTMVHIAFVGTGSIIRGRHAPEAMQESGVDVSGFYGDIPEQVNEMVTKYGGRAYKSYGELLEDTNVDAVVIAVPNFMHAELTIAALKKGKHVLCEKPLATNYHDAKVALETAEMCKRVLMVGHNLHLEPAFALAKEQLDSGKLGKILSFQACIGNEGPSQSKYGLPWFFKPELAGHGASSDIAIHMFETLISILEEPISQVKAITSVRNHFKDDGTPIEVEDTGAVALQMRSGIIGTMLFSWCFVDGWQSPLTFYCEKGVIRVYPNPNTMLSIQHVDGKVENFDSIPKCDWPNGSGVMHRFIQAIENDDPYTKHAISGMLAVKAVDEMFV